MRIDTFLSILRQEVAFFDKTTSGELASRLNSDCGEMAGGKACVVGIHTELLSCFARPTAVLITFFHRSEYRLDLVFPF